MCFIFVKKMVKLIKYRNYLGVVTVLNKLIHITNQLLDLGKRNRLLNYKDSGLKTLKILNTNTDEIFRYLTNSKEISIFKIDEAMQQYRLSKGTTLQTDDTYNYDFQKVYDLFNKAINPGEILCYKQGYTLDKTIKALFKEFRFSLSEKGINSLYMSFGFINYEEEQIKYKAPLLLVPIELEIENGNYTISLYEDEVLLNPTLKYYLNSVFSIDLVEYKNDALQTYYNKIKEILPNEITLDDEASIGIYSFYKMNMYNDLMENKNLVIQNKNIQKLLGEEVVSDQLLKNQKIYPVVNYDSSQLEAIENATNGKSFCLQGPPGSGKSQTITNIISSLLGNGKKILFVSEKIAALRVVFENLKRAGLSDFAIELHSNKTNKKDFIENLYQASVMPKYDLDVKTKFIEVKYENLKYNLGAYEKDLHEQIPGLGLSLIDLYSAYLNVDVKEIDCEIEVEDYNLFDLEKILNLFEEYITLSKMTTYDYRNSPFYYIGYVKEDYILYSFQKDLDITSNIIDIFIKIKEALGDSNLLLNSLNDISNNLALIDTIFKLNDFNSLYFDKKSRNQLISILESYFNISKNLNTDIFKTYDKKVLSENLDEIIANLQTKSFKLLNSDYKKSKDLILKYRLSDTKSNLLVEANQLKEVKNSLLKMASIEANLKKILNIGDKLAIKSIYLDLKSINNNYDIKITSNSYTNLINILKEINFNYNNILNSLTNISALSKIFDKTNFDIENDNIYEVKATIDAIKDRRDLFSSYLNLNSTVIKIKKYHAINYLHRFLDLKEDIDNLALGYKKLFFKQNIKKVVDQSDLLKSFQSYDENEIIESFRELDERILNINRDLIISNNSKNRPEHKVIVEGSEFKILDKEHQKSRRQMPIRQLLEQTFNLALDVKPVFLMSPLSVSTYLASKLNIFDCVIFDEASQIFASDALGAIYRAKQCIIIGDTKQMPPTSFFQVGVDDGIDKDYDMESILDKASMMFDTLSLKWHYRSRSEELITFSNESFYDCNLITIPQAKKHEQGFGIDFYYVKEGRYDPSTRTNAIEAQRVCDMVFEHFDKSMESLGVVAFSNVQAELISDMVEKRLKKNPKYLKFFDESLDEPFFVKNLESVQGDERDRIIFSICYGYNQENKFYQRFGPLNNVGGERRLNVAITRAKYNITVVSSIKYTDINTNNTESKGVILLKSYLEFAQNVVTNKKFLQSNNGIINDVLQFVQSLGYEAYPHYGTSSFKVDIAVKKDNEFILAIMIDGQKYSDSLSDKYRLEKLLLERLGWRYFKLFSTSWLFDKEQEKQRLTYQLEHLDENCEPKTVSNRSYLKVDQTLDSFDSDFIDYQELHQDLAEKYLNSYGLKYLIKELILREQPIHEEFLLKRLLFIMNKPKLTKELKDEILKNMPVEAIKIGEFYFIDQYKEIQLRINYLRDISYVHIDELCDGIYKVASKNNGISIDGCYKTVALFLGFDKLMPNVRKKMDDALAKLYSNNKINIKNNNLFAVKK